MKKDRRFNVFVPIQDSTTSAFQLNCRKAEFSSSLAFLWAAALSSSDTLPRRADILALILSTWWLFCWKHTQIIFTNRCFYNQINTDNCFSVLFHTFLISSSPLAHTSLTLSLCTVKSVSNASCFFSKPCWKDSLTLSKTHHIFQLKNTVNIM